jgi:hypothetical protein
VTTLIILAFLFLLLFTRTGRRLILAVCHHRRPHLPRDVARRRAHHERRGKHDDAGDTTDYRRAAAARACSSQTVPTTIRS